MIHRFQHASFYEMQHIMTYDYQQFSPNLQALILFQLNHTISAGEVAHRVVKIISGFGLSINGQVKYCSPSCKIIESEFDGQASILKIRNVGTFNVQAGSYSDTQ